MAERTFLVPPELAGARLDVALVDLVGGSLSRTRLKELIRDGGVSVDGQPAARAAQALEVGQRIELRDVPRTRQRAGGPAAGALVVVFEDEHLAVIDKPAGQLAHPTTVVRGGTVSEMALERFGPLPSPQGEDRPGIVHRLDADTSGLLVLAKSAAAAQPLVALFRERAVEKHYHALVHGAPRFDSDWISAELGRDPRHPDRVCVRPAGEGKPAETFYRVEERFPRFALLTCRPTTGRTHQIRVHLESIAHPVVGDRVYRGRAHAPLPKDAPPLARHLLHAAALRFAHPVSGAALAFESALPLDFAAWVAWLRARA
jgi:23S rRNA pseudouridine1911/1915/1917 synthase